MRKTGITKFLTYIAKGKEKSIRKYIERKDF